MTDAICSSVHTGIDSKALARAVLTSDLLTADRFILEE